MKQETRLADAKIGEPTANGHIIAYTIERIISDKHIKSGRLKPKWVVPITVYTTEIIRSILMNSQFSPPWVRARFIGNLWRILYKATSWINVPL